MGDRTQIKVLWKRNKCSFVLVGWLVVLDRISLCRAGSTRIRSVHQVDRELVYLPLILSAVIKDLQYYCQAQKLFLTVEPSFPHHGFFLISFIYICIHTLGIHA